MKSSKLTTEVSITPSDWKINLQSKIATVGSCFADVLGQQLHDHKLSVLNNPFGTVFNPLTISKILDLALESKSPSAGLYLQNLDKIWLHHDFHSSQWAMTKEELETELKKKLDDLKNFIQKADVLVITLGTAYAYRQKSTNVLVGNCHKVPADKFIKELLHPDQILIPFEQLVHKLKSFNRNLRIILTVSPVRHTKDTLTLNQVSKSILRLVCHRLSEKFKQIDYFPSYEIMIDELRDYRFFEADLIHPNKVAEDYIFRTFATAYMDSGAQDFMKDWEGIQQMINHRPQHGLTDSQLKLLKTAKAKMNALAEVVNVDRELKEIDARIKEFPHFK